MNDEIIKYLEQATLSLKDLVSQNRVNEKTTLDKIQLIKMKTGIDLIETSDIIAKEALKLEEGKTQDHYFSKILTSLSEFVGNVSKIKQLANEEKYEESMKLMSETNKRNIIIYEILFEEKVDFSGMSAIESRKLENEIQSKIVEQIAILINEAGYLTYEAMLTNAKKLMA